MTTLNRRSFIGSAVLCAAGGAGAQAQSQRGDGNLTIRDVRVIITQPTTALTVVKVETSEPGLYGLGCATFAYQPTAIAAAVNDYLRPFLIGKNPFEIEDIWQSCYQSAYWRNGPVLNNALSGIDQALWDIKGKVAGMPVHELFGGKAREAVPVYVVPGSRSLKEIEEDTHKAIAEGFYVMKINAPQPQSYKGPRIVTKKVPGIDPRRGILESAAGQIHEPGPHFRSVLSAFEHLRNVFGSDVELLHDVHSRIPPIDGIGFAKDVEQYKPFFIEDLFAPEDGEYFRIVRQQTSTPMAMGELFNNPHEYVPLIKDRLIDFIRVHISQIGGLTPARKLAALCEVFNVRTAWHGPADVSPVGHAANLALDFSVWNLGIQEAGPLRNPGDKLKEVFPGTPEVRDGYLWPNEKPGLGVDLDEKAAAKYPFRGMAQAANQWGNVRRADGSVTRP